MDPIGRGFATVLMLLLAAACQRAGLPPGAADKCADYTGGFGSHLSGTLHGERDLARRISRRLRALDALGQDRREQTGDSVRLIPICDHHRLSERKLKNGRFVAVLTGPGTTPRFSPVANDTVLWWVYGEDLETASGRDTTIWHSEFLSLHASASAPYITTARLQICPSGGRPSQEAVYWHDGSCHMAAAGGSRPAGDRPWFGCTRGCCFAAMPSLDSERGSLPTDSLPRDTTQSRDTT